MERGLLDISDPAAHRFVSTLSHCVKSSMKCHAGGKALGTMHVLELLPEDIWVSRVCMRQLRRFEVKDDLGMGFGLAMLKSFDSFGVR